MPGKADNVERFAFLYEYTAQPLAAGLKRASTAVETFVSVTTKGITGVIEGVGRMTSAIAVLGGSAMMKILRNVGVSVRSLGEGAWMLGSGGKKALGWVWGMGKGMREWGAKAFQVDQRMHSIGTGLKFIAKVGGLAVLLGPLLPLIKPFMMLVDIIMETLQPAMDLLKSAMQGAFAPLSKAIYDLTLKLLPHLMRVVDPIVEFLVRGVEMLGALFEEGTFDQLVSVFDDLLPLVQQIVNSFVRDFLKPVGGVLFKTVIKLFQSLVHLAVDFVKTIAPYLPKFFHTLSQIAEVILSGLGDAFDVLLKEFAKILTGPDFMRLLQSMVDLLQAMLPIVTQLLPPMTKLFAEVLGKFLVPATIVILTKLTKLIGDALYLAQPLVGYIKDVLDALNEWWDRNENVFGDVITGIKDVAVRTVDWISEKFTAFWDMMKVGANAVIGFFDKIYTDVERLIPKVKEVFDGIMLGAKAVPVLGDILKLVGAAAGEYVVQPSVRLVGEAGPEWIVPDNAAGIMKYVPMMLDSALGARPAPEASVRATAELRSAAPAGNAVADLLRETNRLLREIGRAMEDQGDTDLLPEAL